jgi:hypothetical protein
MKQVISFLAFFACFLFVPHNGHWSFLTEYSLTIIDEIHYEMNGISQNNKKNSAWEPPAIDFNRLNSNLQQKMSDFIDILEKKESSEEVVLPKESPSSSFLRFSLKKKHSDLLSSIAGRFGGMVAMACEENSEDVDPLLIAAIIKVESDFDHRAVSQNGAKGLMQLMPVNYKNLGINPFDPAENIQVGVQIMADNLKRYSGDIRLALAAYNAGPNAVKKHGGVPPFKETKKYIQKVTKTHREFQRL